MSDLISLPPLSLYVHMPWCVRKCPYCDFNSHAAPGDEQGGVPEAAYISALLQDLDQDLADFPDTHAGERELVSIFIGGGTPSLISPAGYATLFTGLRQRLRFADDIEITLEANPGTVEQGLFQGYREVGINRLSIGVQTFQTAQLKALGRIHSGDEAQCAAQSAREVGFSNFNLDLMHGLPGQSLQQALDDLRQAIALEPTHLSWYQLTLEPNTVFFREQPVLPDEDVLADIQDAGQALLAAEGYVQYEVSAYARRDQRCRHNLNYWQFGDYLGIGAGAHGKLTQITKTALQIIRTTKTRVPKDYLRAAAADYRVNTTTIAERELPFEFMLNTLRLIDGVPTASWSERTGLSQDILSAAVSDLQDKGLLQAGTETFAATALGQRYLNRVIENFLPD